MIFDGDCGFCRFWIERWRSWTGAPVEYIPYQDASIGERFPEISVGRFETAVQLVEKNGRVRQGADAVFQSLAGVWWLAWLSGLYRLIPLFARVCEVFYGFVARRRMFFSRINRFLFGRNPEPPGYELTSQIFIRLLGFIFLAAFVSLWVQIHGLVGEQGILPANQFMKSVNQIFDQNETGIGRYMMLPTLGWIASGDVALHAGCLLGVICSLSVMAGFYPALALAGCWLFYISLTNLGQAFLSYQWDVLLLETGFLALMIVPWGRRLKLANKVKPVLGILLARWLLFRLMLESGAVKLWSGDPTWHNLTALQYHFETQPLPNWISWYASQLPAGLLKSATVVMFAIELIVPFLFFAPRRLRLFACLATVGLQLGIVATGNYGCFNWLTIVLCLVLLDDLTLRKGKSWLSERRLVRALGVHFSKLVPHRKVGRGDVNSAPMSAAGPPPVRGLDSVHRSMFVAYAIVVFLIGLAQLDNVFGSRSRGGGPVTWLRKKVEPFRIVNSYGLFAVMTTSRPELIIEGSLDGIEWRPYIFKYKPGPLDRRPPIVPLHMPRLDWQMWFAALQEGNPPRWLGNFAQRLFEQSPAVLALLANDPFPGQPPKYMRVLAYDYRFTNRGMRKNTGQWWMALNRRYYVPVMTWQKPESAATPGPK